MSSQRGNDNRSRSQKHKNVRAFKNDLHDTSHITKKINNLEFYGLCVRCKDIIDWKVKYKKYKPLTAPKKCVKCLEKKVKNAYYIVCQDCCTSFKICSKCSKPTDELEFGESEIEKKRKEDLFQQELKLLTERQRRKFLRLLEKGYFTKENLSNDPELMKRKHDFDDEDDDFDDEEEDENFDEEGDYDDDEDEEDLELENKLKIQKDDGDEEYETLDEDEEDIDDEFEDDEDVLESEDEINKSSKNKINKGHSINNNHRQTLSRNKKHNFSKKK